jgi:hypothetical protein
MHAGQHSAGGCGEQPASKDRLLVLHVVGQAENGMHWKPAWITLFGRAPLFYYLLHLYLIHFGAGMAALLQGRMGDATWILRSHFGAHRPADYGVPLWGVYLAWMIIVAILYLPCRWYAGFKQRHRSPWLSYL